MDAIIAYLARRPNAADTAVGIAGWWLMQSGEPVSVAEVQQALDTMVARGLLVVETGAAGDKLYRAAKPDDPAAGDGCAGGNE